MHERALFKAEVIVNTRRNESFQMKTQQVDRDHQKEASQCSIEQKVECSLLNQALSQGGNCYTIFFCEDPVKKKYLKRKPHIQLRTQFF